MSARSRPPTPSTKTAGAGRAAGATRVDAGMPHDPLLDELRGRLQEALSDIEEQRAAGEQLGKLLESAEQRVAQLEAAEIERLRAAAPPPDAARYAEELEQRRKERAAAEERARSDDARRLVNAEKRLRTMEATLAQTLQALEEHRVTAVEQRMIAEATEHHAAELKHEMQQRVQRAEALAVESRAALDEALQTSEERRILAAEMQTILEATEYRLAQLEQAASTWEAERTALRAEAEAARAAMTVQCDELAQEIDALRAGSEQLRAERASTTAALERTMAELALQRDVAAGLGVERDAALERIEQLAHAVAQREQTLAELTQRITALEAEAQSTSHALTQAGSEAAALRLAAAQAQAAWDAARAGLENDLAGVRGELAERTTAVVELEAASGTLAQEKAGLAQQLAALEAELRQVSCARDEALAEARATIESEQAARAQDLEQARREHVQHAEDMSRELSATRAHGEQLQSEVHRLAAEVDEQRRALATATSEHHAVAQHLREVEEALARRDHDLEELHATLTRERDEWTAARSELLASLEREGGAQQEMIAARQALEEKLHVIETELHAERDRATRLNEERAQVATALGLVREELKEQSDALAAANAERDSLSDRLHAAEADGADTAHRLTDAIAGHQRDIAAWHAAQAAHAAELSTATGRINALSKERDDLAATLERERTGREQIATSLQQVQHELASAQARLQEAESRHAAATQALTHKQKTLEDRLAETDAARASAVAAGAKAQAAHSEQQEALQAALEQVKQELRERTAAGQRSDQALQEVRNQAAALEREVAELRKAREAAVRAQAQLTESIRAGSEQRTVLERQIAELERSNEEGKQERERLMESLRLLGDEKAAAERQWQGADAERAQLQVEIGRLGEARTALQQRLQDIQAQLAAEQNGARELRELHAHGTELYQLVESELQESRAAGDAAAKQVEELRQVLEGRARDLSRMQGALADAERKHGEEQQRSQQLAAEVAALTQARDALQKRADAWADRDRVAARAAELERALAEADQQATALRTQLTETQDQLHGAMQQVATASAAAADVAALQVQLDEGRAETARLQLQVENLSGQRDVLQRERDQLKRRAQEADDADRLRAEQERLAAKVDDLERQQTEAMQRHSAAVSGYMVELNQRSELLRQRELQIEKLNEELCLLQQACEDGVTQAGGLRQERDLLELRVRELESQAKAPRPAAPAKTPATESFRLAPSDTGTPPAAAADKSAAGTAPAKAPAKAPAAQPGKPGAAPAVAKSPQPAAPISSPTVIVAPSAVPKGLKPSRSASGILNVVHLEDGAPLRDAVRTSVSRYGRVKYAHAQDAPAIVTPPTLLTINLLVKSIDPLVTMAHADAWGVQPPQAFAYCTDGARGSVIGLTDFFPHPFDLESCAVRMHDRTGGIQRLLVVGESVELLNEIRSIMNRIRCSTSVALDARQAFDLVSMVKPQFVLVDVGLQRAEGLRLIARLRADPAYAGVGIGLMWTRDLDANEFRLNVARAVRDSRFTAEDLGRQVAQTIVDLGFSTEELRDAG